MKRQTRRCWSKGCNLLIFLGEERQGHFLEKLDWKGPHGNYEKSMRDGQIDLRSKHTNEDGPLPPKFAKCKIDELVLHNTHSMHRATVRAASVLEPFNCRQLFNLPPPPVAISSLTRANSHNGQNASQGTVAARPKATHQVPSPLTTPRTLSTDDSPLAQTKIETIVKPPTRKNAKKDEKEKEIAPGPVPAVKAAGTARCRSKAKSAKKSSNAIQKVPVKQDVDVCVEKAAVAPPKASGLLKLLKANFVPPPPPKSEK